MRSLIADALRPGGGDVVGLVQRGCAVVGVRGDHAGRRGVVVDDMGFGSSKAVVAFEASPAADASLEWVAVASLGLDLEVCSGRDRGARWAAAAMGCADTVLAAWVAASASRSFLPYHWWLRVASPEHPGGNAWHLTQDWFAHLDPRDLARLPDGSRAVDARALLSLIEHLIVEQEPK